MVQSLVLVAVCFWSGGSGRGGCFACLMLVLGCAVHVSVESVYWHLFFLHTCALSTYLNTQTTIRRPYTVS